MEPKIIKTRKEVPTVIEWDGRLYSLLPNSSPKPKAKGTTNHEQRQKTRNA